MYMNETYTVNEIAKTFKMSPETIRRHIRSGIIKAVKMGIGRNANWRVNADERERLLLEGIKEG